MERQVSGKVFYCGDCVNTDVMSPGRFEPYEGPAQLARIALIDYESSVPFVEPGAANSSYSIIFAGVEFGCGSSRETAPQALYYAGTRVIIAKSFARIFFRNCVNMGLLWPITYPHSFNESVTGCHALVDFAARQFSVEGGAPLAFPDFGPLQAIVEAGGLINYTKKCLRGREVLE